MMDIDKAFEEFIEFPEGSSGNLVTTVSAKLFAKYCVEKLQEENERLLFANRYNADMYRQIDDERKRLQDEVERLRLQLAACGVVALANTPESAARQRDMHPDYMSASCQDVIAAVDREIALREERDQLKAYCGLLSDRLIALKTTAERYLPDYNEHPLIQDVDDLLDDLPTKSLADHDADVIDRFKKALFNEGRTRTCITKGDFDFIVDQLRQQAKEMKS